MARVFGQLTSCGGRGRQDRSDRGGHYGAAWARARTTGAARLVNGEPGIVAWSAKGRPLGVMACTVVDGRTVQILVSD